MSDIDISSSMIQHLCHVHRGYEQHGTVATLLALRAELDRAEAKAAAVEGEDDATADKIFDWLANAVGAKNWTGADGSESWEGDVHGTIYNILRTAGVLDEETDAVATWTKEAAAVEAMREAAIAIVPSGWLGAPHQSNMDYGPNVSAITKAAIRAITPPAPMTDMARFDAAQAERQIAEHREALLTLCMAHGMPADGLPLQWLGARLSAPMTVAAAARVPEIAALIEAARAFQAACRNPECRVPPAEWVNFISALAALAEVKP